MAADGKTKALTTLKVSFRNFMFGSLHNSNYGGEVRIFVGHSEVVKHLYASIIIMWHNFPSTWSVTILQIPITITLIAIKY